MGFSIETLMLLMVFQSGHHRFPVNNVDQCPLSPCDILECMVCARNILFCRRQEHGQLEHKQSDQSEVFSYPLLGGSPQSEGLVPALQRDIIVVT